MTILTKGVTALALLAATASLAVADDMAGMKMAGMQMAGAKATTQIHKGRGTITALDAKAGTVTIAHGAIASIGWPAMSMTFKASKTKLAKLKTGEKVDFSFHEASKGQYQINSITPAM